MKKVLILAVLAVFTLKLNGQQIRSSFYKSNTSFFDLSKKSSNDRIDSLLSKNPNLDPEAKKQINSLKDTSDVASMAKFINNSNQDPHVVISGIGGITDLETANQSGGNFSIASTFRLGDYHRMGKSKWVDPAFLYLAFNARTSSSSDSSILAKTFLFPDISKRDFVIGAFFSFRSMTNWAIEPTVEFSLNQYKKTLSDSTTHVFKSESAMLGVKFTKTYFVNIAKDSTVPISFSLYPYYSLISVDPKYSVDYNAILGEKNLPSTFNSVGFEATLQVSKFVIFANMKMVLNNTNNISNQDLKGFTYVLGTIISADLLSF